MSKSKPETSSEKSNTKESHETVKNDTKKKKTPRNRVLFMVKVYH